MINRTNEKPNNFDNDYVKVKHSELKRYGNSPYKSECSVCKKGLLLVVRDIRTFKLSRMDRCVNCGQRFYYIDEKINEEELV